MPPDPPITAADPDSSAFSDLNRLGYAEAVAELEEILAQLDGDDVDVDHLAAQVRRAAALISLCRDRLTSARVEVTRIVADLDVLTPVSSEATEAGPGEPADDELDG